MQKYNMKLILSQSFILLLLAPSFTLAVAEHQLLLQLPHTFIIYTDGINYFAKNINNDIIQFQGINATAVIQSALDSGNDVTLILKKGNYPVNFLTIKYNNTKIDGLGSVTISTTGNELILLSPRGSTLSNIKITDVTLAGNGTTDYLIRTVGNKVMHNIGFNDLVLTGFDKTGIELGKISYISIHGNNFISSGVAVTYTYLNFQSSGFVYDNFQITNDGSQRITCSSNNSTTFVCLPSSNIDIKNIKDYGAKGDGVTDDTDAFRSATSTGQFLYIPEGTYLTRQFTIPSNMIIEGDGIGKTVIKRIVDRRNINTLTFNYTPGPSGGDTAYSKAFVKNHDFVSGNSNIEIRNLTIDGNGYVFKKDGYQNKDNPALFFKRSSNIRMDNVEIDNSMNFSLWFRECDYVTLGKIIINGNTDPNRVNDRNNQDGLHFLGTRYVLLDQLIVRESYDDSLVIGSDDASKRTAFQYNIEKVELKSINADGVRILARGDYDVYSINIDNIVVNGYNIKGVNIQHSQFGNAVIDGSGVVRDVNINNIIIRGKGSAIDYKWLVITSRPPNLYDTSAGTQKLRNININNLIILTLENVSTGMYKKILLESTENVNIKILIIYPVTK